MNAPSRHTATCLLVMLCVSATAAAPSKLEKTTVTYRTVDGHEILADVHRPPGDAVRPVVVWLHGGALINGHRESIPGAIRRLADERGYALVSFDYRLAPESKLPEIVADVEAAFRWLAGDGAQRFHLDRERVVVTGGSAGGYLTLLSGHRAKPRPRALVAYWGYGDLVGDWYSKPSPHPRHNARPISREDALAQIDGRVVSDSRQRKGNGGLFYVHTRQTGTWPKEVTGFDPTTEAEKIAPFEPVRNVDESYPPTLLVHGTDDTDVPFEQSELMVRQFERHRVPHELIRVENGEHGLAGAKRDDVDAAHRRTLEFVVRHLER